MSNFPTKILLAADGAPKRAGCPSRDLHSREDQLRVARGPGRVIGELHWHIGPIEITDIPVPNQEELTKEAQRLLNTQSKQHEAARAESMANANNKSGKDSLFRWQGCARRF